MNEDAVTDGAKEGCDSELEFLLTYRNVLSQLNEISVQFSRETSKRQCRHWRRHQMVSGYYSEQPRSKRNLCNWF